MKRKLQWLLIVLLCFTVSIVMAEVIIHPGQMVIYRFEAKSWEFQRADGPTLTVIIDPAGTLTLLENGMFVGQRYNSCQVAD